MMGTWNRVYIAGKYDRREELAEKAKDLELLGYEVTSRWLNGAHDLPPTGVDIVQTESDFNAMCALEDWEDVIKAGVLISFTEEPGVGGRGGRHVEFGMGVSLGGMRLILVGPRENVFHYLHGVEQYDTWEECLEALGG